MRGAWPVSWPDDVGAALETLTMKYKHQMSLIARRAQIRRAATDRKDAPLPHAAKRPQLRLVFSSGDLNHIRKGPEAGDRLRVVE